MKITSKCKVTVNKIRTLNSVKKFFLLKIDSHFLLVSHYFPHSPHGRVLSYFSHQDKNWERKKERKIEVISMNH